MLANIPVDEAYLEKQIGRFRDQQGQPGRDKDYDEGLISTLADSRRFKQREITRMLDYWLCIHGLTFGAFRAGQACEEPVEEGTCDVGKEHADGMAADRRRERAALAKQAGKCSCFVVVVREKGEMCDHELAAQELEGAADLTQHGQGG